MVVIENNEYSIFMSGEKVEREAEEVQESQKIDELGDFTSYTEKEIFDIPSVLENVWSGRIDFKNKSIHNETLEAL